MSFLGLLKTMVGELEEVNTLVIKVLSDTDFIHRIYKQHNSINIPYDHC